jgi:hypothetical protein
MKLTITVDADALTDLNGDDIDCLEEDVSDLLRCDYGCRGLVVEVKAE